MGRFQSEYEVACPSPSVEDRVDSMMRLSRL